MPYLKTVHFFRLFESIVEDASAQEGEVFLQSAVEGYFGIVREPKNGYAYRNKALALKEEYSK